ncbi:hypothetical protein MLD52_09500 [Puniceicoccaceae bacterium K14]|nr:hypothetical protein [Puniceicoccaceae bacterium K14]
MKLQTFHRFEGRQLGSVRVDLGCKPRIAVTHQFLSQTLRNAAFCEFRRKGVSEGMKVYLATKGVEFGDASSFVIPVDRFIWSAGEIEDGISGLLVCDEFACFIDETSVYGN